MNGNEPYPRFLEAAVRDALADTPVVVIQGARQVGKSTLAQFVAAGSADARQVTLDDPAALAVAESDPAFFVEQAGRGLLVIDEVQRAPGLILPLKASVDRDRRPGRFLLTGSADLLQVKGVGDSLAGRAETVELRPLSQGELTRRSEGEDFVSWLLSDVDGGVGRFQTLDPAVVVTGGYPEVVRRTPQRAGRWFDSYVERLADHDARDLHRGGYADHLRHLLTLLAAGGTQELVKAKTARALGVAENTIDTYLRLATTMRLVESLPSWGRSQRGRVVRRPKICLHDTGLSAALAKFTIARALSIGGREYYGALVEQFVALELAKQQPIPRTPFTTSATSTASRSTSSSNWPTDASSPSKSRAAPPSPRRPGPTWSASKTASPTETSPEPAFTPEPRPPSSAAGSTSSPSPPSGSTDCAPPTRHPGGGGKCSMTGLAGQTL